MKKILLFSIIMFIFPLIAKADLTTKQAQDLSFYAENFVNYGNMRRDEKGYSLLFYAQGNYRIDGYQEKMSYFTKYYYHKGITINGDKWAFDCASFVSYMYKKAFGLTLTKAETKNVDAYSGLRIMSSSAIPWTVNDFYNNASKNKHFYFIHKNVAVSNLDLNTLKPGDLIIIKGSHIMLYIGNGKIAQAASSAVNYKVSPTNSGVEINVLKNKYPNNKVYVARIKNNVINPNTVVDMNVKWVDNNTVMNLRYAAYYPVLQDSYSPKIGSLSVSKKWAKANTVTIKSTDKSGIVGWNITSSSKEPSSWNNVSSTSTLNITNRVIENNGTYYFWVRDVYNNKTIKTFTVNKVDNNVPLISKLTAIKKGSRCTLQVTASDSLSGLNHSPYSWNGKKSWTYNRKYVGKVGNTYTVYVRDAIGNITSLTSNACL